jgi:hypothetical protein
MPVILAQEAEIRRTQIQSQQCEGGRERGILDDPFLRLKLLGFWKSTAFLNTLPTCCNVDQWLLQ